MLSAIVSALHLFALALGLPAVYLRGRALKGRLDREGFQRLFVADSVWGVAAGLWLVTGLLRAFGGLEKGSAFYLVFRLLLEKEMNLKNIDGNQMYDCKMAGSLAEGLAAELALASTI